MSDDRTDRTAIAGLLGPHFPHMAGATSGEWQVFLNAATGLTVPSDADNAVAFDAWRKALASQGLPGVWGPTPAEEADMAARVARRKAAAEAWRAEQAERMRVEMARLAEIGLRARGGGQ